jgi:hypothetical protein
MTGSIGHQPGQMAMTAGPMSTVAACEATSGSVYLTGRGARLQAQLLLWGGIGLVLGANGRVSVSSTGISHRHHTQGSHTICS